MRTPIIAGNWKLNKTIQETSSFFDELLPVIKETTSPEIIICPPFTSLQTANQKIANSNIKLGAQNISLEIKGNFTGEISAQMIEELCTHVIIGHSERRNLYLETDEEVNKKVKNALSHGLIPIICVGEKLKEKENGNTSAIISNQVRKSLKGINRISADHLIIAYEPVWAIGSGKTASPDETNTLIQNVIRPTVSGLVGSDVAENTRVLYGGSINEKNIQTFLAKTEIDGALIGGASLKTNIFAQIIKLSVK